MKVSDAIVIDKDILGGIPVFKGTRVPVKNLFDYLEAGDSLNDFLNDFDYIPRENCIIILENSELLLIDAQIHENANFYNLVMKYISLVIVIVLFSGFAAAQKPGLRLIGLDLKGKVKQVIQYEYEKNNKNSKQDTSIVITHFDENGNELDQTYHDKNGLIRKTLFKYSKGKMVGSEYRDEKLITNTIHLYNADGNEIEMDMYSNENLPGVISYKKAKMITKYDKKGNRIEEESYFDEKLNLKTINIYNAKNQKIEADNTEYMPSHIKKEKEIFEYDNAGYNVKTEVYDLDGILVEEQIKSYGNIDQSGNWRSQTYIFKGYNNKTIYYLNKSIIKREITYFNK